MKALETTSLPSWLIEAGHDQLDRTGRAWSVYAIGSGGASLASKYEASDVHLRACDDAAQASKALSSDARSATVGWRVLLVGNAADCLTVRATALRVGLMDEEIRVAVSATELRRVTCVHCGAVTEAEAALDSVIPCGGCERKLLIYSHVSRRLGTHLGFMVDAETPRVPSEAMVQA